MRNAIIAAVGAIIVALISGVFSLFGGGGGDITQTVSDNSVGVINTGSGATDVKNQTP